MKKNKHNYSKVILIGLIVLAFFGSYFLAKFVSTFRGNDSTGVAKWSVDYTSSSDTINLVSGNHAESCVLNITSTSEVSANYSIILSSVPNEMEIKLDDGTIQTANENGNITFENVGTIDADDNDTHTHTITFYSPLDSDIPNLNEIEINVEFVQKN